MNMSAYVVCCNVCSSVGGIGFVCCFGWCFWQVFAVACFLQCLLFVSLLWCLVVCSVWRILSFLGLSVCVRVVFVLSAISHVV